MPLSSEGVASLLFHKGAIEERWDSPLSVEPLEGGLTNSIYKLSYPDGREAVLRLFSSKTKKLGIDREQEVAIQTTMQPLAPKVYYVDPFFRFSLIELLRGERVSAKEILENSSLWEGLISALIKVAQTEIPGERLDPLQRSRFYREGIGECPAEIDPITEKMEKEVFPQLVGAPTVACHNDLTGYNFIFNRHYRELHIIDWEFAALGDPAFELAVLFHNAKCSLNTEEAFLNSYRERADREKVDVGQKTLSQRVNLNRPVIAYLSLFWALIVQEEGCPNAPLWYAKELAYLKGALETLS